MNAPARISSKPRLRAAKFADIPSLAGLAHDAHRRSRLAGRTSIVEIVLKRQLQQAIASHGTPGEGGSFVAVVDNGICLEGVIVGHLQRVYWVCDALEARDLLFYVRPGAHPATARRLLAAMHKWAASVPGVIEVNDQAMDTVIPAERGGAFLRRAGMVKAGEVWRKEIER